MEEFRMEKELPTCKVTKNLLEELEKYILKKKKEIENNIGELPEYKYSDFKITVTDDLGEESIDSTKQLNERFLSSTTDVVIRLIADWREKGSLQLYIRFSNRSYMYRRSKVTIESEKTSARELVMGIYDSLDKIIQANKTINWLFHPPQGLSFIIFAISILLLFIGLSALGVFIEEGSANAKPIFIRCSSASAIGLAYLYLGPKIHPYVTFDSPKTDNQGIISKTFATIMLGIFLYFIVYPFLREVLFG